MLNRRRFVQAGLAGSVAGALVPSLSGFAAGEPSLGELAAQSGLKFGTAFQYHALGDGAYTDLIAHHAKIMTPENHLKFDYLNPRGEGYNFGPVDEMFAFTDTFGAQIFAQPLFWNDFYPPWLNKLSVKELQHVFDEHIDTVVSRYAGKMHSWGVVNETFAPWDNLPNAFRDGPWYWAYGESYVARAFKRVAELDPVGRLAINEAQCENNYKWGKAIRPQLLALVDRLLDDGVPLHAVGLQAHLQPQWDFDYEDHARYIESLAARGLDIYITELDVNDMEFSRDHDKRDQQVGAHYEDYLSHILGLSAVKMLIVWDMADPYSWYRELDQGWGKDARSSLFDDSFAPKPAYVALEKALRARISG